MSTSSPHQITELLIDWSNGDQTALGRLMPLVYSELRRMAHRYMRNERPVHTLQATALVNEAYLRLVDHRGLRWKNRAQFFAVASAVMRHVLVDHARGLKRKKREGARDKVFFDEGSTFLTDSLARSQDRYLDLLALDEAITELEAEYPRKGRVVEMRFFGGMSNREIAAVLDVHPNVVIRDWKFAIAWLRRKLGV